MDITTFLIMFAILYFPVRAVFNYLAEKKKEEKKKIEKLEKGMNELREQIDKMFAK